MAGNPFAITLTSFCTGAKAVRHSPEFSRGGGGPADSSFYEGKHVRYVYLLRSITHPDKSYTGITTDLQSRIAKHNSGGSPHTAKYRPWKVAVALRFDDDNRATAFEKYLKAGSGRAFANRHFL